MEVIDLNWEMVYTQNLCRNYFKSETSKNKIWKQAAEIWIDILKEELDDLFSTKILVLLTSQLLFDVLLKEKNDQISTMHRSFTIFLLRFPFNKKRASLKDL